MDWRNPDYYEIFTKRIAMLNSIRAEIAAEQREGREPSILPTLKTYYKANPADFISDFGVTYDPRNVERGLPAFIPFVLFPRQREWVDWLVGHWLSQTPGLCEKSRDMGISWLAMATACTLCLFHDGVAVGCGSRKEDLVDKIGTMKPLLPKARMFMENLPEEFRGGWVSWRDAPFMRINFPDTESIITGEAGDQIGRGDRASFYLVDESSYLERPEQIEMSLSQTTNCRIDMSSVNGMNNPFAKKRHEGKIDVFQFNWRQDPRKDEFWYEALSLGSDQFVERPDGTKIYGKGLDPVTIAQEVDCDYSASVHGIVIPGAWVRACIDALEKLKIHKSGAKTLALDVADEGVDKNALCGGTGVEIDFLEEWSGKGADLYATTQRAFEVCDERGYSGFRYDADGLGAGVRGDARLINEARLARGGRALNVEGFRGSEAVLDPDGIVEGTIGSNGDKGRTNKDYFANHKAQVWWSVRRRIQKTHRWVEGGKPCKPDEVFSISSKCAGYLGLVSELSQPTYTINGAGKILINKKPDGMKSPNKADAAVMRSAQGTPRMVITGEMVQAIVRAGARRR
jgi:hypothetical protein